MFRPRVIPVLLLSGRTLVKSRQFQDFRYIGDPINAVRLFNEMKADELAFLDILATKENRPPSLELVKGIGEEASMPFAVGGGIRTIEDVRRVIGAGAEKVIINTAAVENPDFIKQASETFGASTIVVCLDVKRTPSGGSGLVPQRSQSSSTPILPAHGNGAGKRGPICRRDGMMNGYDIDLIRRVSETVSVQVISLGGAGSLEHLRQAYAEGHASAMAAGSMFVFQGPKRGVLINYPDKSEIQF